MQTKLADVDEVPDDSSLLVTLLEDGEEREAILVRLDGEVACWRNYCMHWTDVKLDKGNGAYIRNDEIVCQKHAATFEKDSGFCNFGPCEGSVLEEVDVEVNDGAVFLVDDDYTFSHRGPAEEDDSGQDGPGGRIDFTGS
ncbi:Rieske (2Fe-2S) protein [Natronomonas sp. EA1]|uniref:Rieske (2Fe-2S) protein n=1 Tax=Natronomonas sp. EA1 TaxID=3421655 RepID=UPI003EBA1738